VSEQAFMAAFRRASAAALLQRLDAYVKQIASLLACSRNVSMFSCGRNIPQKSHFNESFCASQVRDEIDPIVAS
jgi:hypothetical protein